MSLTPKLLGCALMVAIGLCPVTARAQGGSSAISDTERADALLREAIALADANDWVGAGKKLEEAWTLKKSYDIAGNLGQVYEKQGRFADSARYYDHSMRNFPPSGKPELKQALVTRFNEVRAKVGAVTVKVSVPEAKLLIAGKEVGESPLTAPLYLEPGSYELDVQKPGHTSERRTLLVGAGAELAIDVDLRAVAGSGASSDKPLWPGIVMGVVGAAGIGAGIGLIVVSKQRAGEAEDLASTCAPLTQACATEGDGLLSEANGLQGGGIAALALGGAAAIGMAVYLAIPGDEPEAKKATLQLAPILGPSLAGFTLQTSF